MIQFNRSLPKEMGDKITQKSICINPKYNFKFIFFQLNQFDNVYQFAKAHFLTLFSFEYYNKRYEKITLS